MDEDISIINSNTRNEKIKNFFVKNKKLIIFFIIIIIYINFKFFGLIKFIKIKKKINFKKYNNAIIEYSKWII